MAFIISKNLESGGEERKLYYLVRNYREGNKIKRETLSRLGESPDLSKALLVVKKIIEDVLLDTEKREAKLERVKRGDFTGIVFFGAPYRTASRLSECIEQNRIKLKKLREDEVKLLEQIKLYPNCSARDTLL